MSDKLKQIDEAIKEAKWRIDNCDYDLKLTHEAGNLKGREVTRHDSTIYETNLKALELYREVSKAERKFHKKEAETSDK